MIDTCAAAIKGRADLIESTFLCFRRVLEFRILPHLKQSVRTSARHVASLSLLFVVALYRYITPSEELVSISNRAWFIGRTTTAKLTA